MSVLRRRPSMSRERGFRSKSRNRGCVVGSEDGPVPPGRESGRRGRVSRVCGPTRVTVSTSVTVATGRGPRPPVRPGVTRRGPSDRHCPGASNPGFSSVSGPAVSGRPTDSTVGSNVVSGPGPPFLYCSSQDSGRDFRVLRILGVGEMDDLPHLELRTRRQGLRLLQ